MTNLLQIDFEENNVRFVNHPEEKFDFGIVAKDLALALEYNPTNQGTQTVMRLVDEDYKGVASVHTPSGTQSMSVIWEAGLYQALARTNKPKAKPFQKKLYEEVLPQIRKTGKYDGIENPEDEKEILRQNIVLYKKQYENAKKLMDAMEERDKYFEELKETKFNYNRILQTVNENLEDFGLEKVDEKNVEDTCKTIQSFFSEVLDELKNRSRENHSWTEVAPFVFSHYNDYFREGQNIPIGTISNKLHLKFDIPKPKTKWHRSDILHAICKFSKNYPVLKIKLILKTVSCYLELILEEDEDDLSFIFE